MMQATNLRILGKYSDGAYRCLIEIDGENALYCARDGDDAPLNMWIMERVRDWENAGNAMPDYGDSEENQPVANGVQTL